MPRQKFHRIVVMVLLILTGEAAFFLPFVLARVFRPTFLKVFHLTNLELGLAYSAYGIVAIIAYLLGGPLADRFKPRKLIGLALVLTGLGGVYLATIPSFFMLKILYCFWGISTILLFWSALIRATRVWGGDDNQGKGFGILDGGRGLVAASMGTILVFLFSGLLPEDVANITDEERANGFSTIIYIITGYVFAIGILAWFLLRPSDNLPQKKAPSFNWKGVGQVGKLPTVWIQALIIICAYCGYKISDDFSLYAQEVMGYNEVNAAGIGTLTLWVRPIVTVLAGIIGDRISSSKALIFVFGLMALGAAGMGSGILGPDITWLFLVMVLTTSTGIFALRGLYFAITKEGKVPLAFTGTAVGLISVIGYTPDIFMGPLMGYILDSNPGVPGHRQVFLMLAGISIVGMILGVIFRKVSKKQMVISGNP